MLPRPCRHYRRFVIEALIRDALGGSDDSTSNSRHLPAKLHEAAALVSRELAYVDGVAAQSPKNYQLWCVGAAGFLFSE